MTTLTALKMPTNTPRSKARTLNVHDR
jgi:hypothetical protein